jgi:heme A synthase
MEPNSEKVVSLEEPTIKLTTVLLAAALVASLALNGILALHRSEAPVTKAGVQQSSSIQSGAYQAVFLTNGQVYYGKLTQPDASFYRLTSVRYSDPANRLIKLTSAPQTPEDLMVIPTTQVLFWENLNSSGQIGQQLSQQQ